jgi:transposase
VIAVKNSKRRRRKKQPTEIQMIKGEAKLLRKMMRNTKSERLRRLRRLKLTDSSRLEGQTISDSLQQTSREIVQVGREGPSPSTGVGQLADGQLRARGQGDGSPS